MRSKLFDMPEIAKIRLIHIMNEPRSVLMARVKSLTKYDKEVRYGRKRR
jgi:hypothetical protein